MEGRYCAQIWCALLVVIALLPSPGLGAADARASGSGDADSAKIAQYELAVANNPQDAASWLLLAQLRAERQEWVEAADCYRRVVQLGPVSKEIRLEYGDALKQSGRLDLAIEQYNLVMMAPRTDDLLKQAENAKEQGNVVEAERLLREVLQDKPKTAEAWLSLAKLYLEQEKWQDAAAAYLRADELEPLDPADRTNYADALRKSNQLEQALAQYDRLLASQTGAAPATKPLTSSISVAAHGTNEAARPVAPATSTEGFRVQETAAREQVPPAEVSQTELVWPVEPDTADTIAVESETHAVEKPAAAGTSQPAAGQFYVPRDPAQVSTLLQNDDSGADDVYGGNTSTNESAGDDRQNKSDEPAVQPQTQDEWLSAARSYAASKQWQEAADAFAQVLSMGSADAAVRLEYAEALRQSGELQRAEEEYNRVLHNDAANIDAKIGLAKVLALGGKLDEAMYLLDQLETNADAVRRARIARVYAYFVNDYVQEAWRDIGDLLAREPWNAEALELVKQQASWDQIRASLESQAGNEELIGLIEDIIKAEAAMAEVEPAEEAERAEWHYQRGDLAKAQREFELLVEADPQDARAWQRLAQIYTWDKAWEAALDAYDNYLKVVPEDYWAQLRHAQVLLYMGEPAEAADELWSLIMDSDTPIEVYQEALLAYAVALNATGRSKEAIKWFEEALIFQPRNVEILSSYASALAGQKRFDDALALYESALHEAPDNDGIKLGMGQVYSWQGNQTKAIQTFNTISMDSPYYLPGRIGAAYAYLWDGHRSDALALAYEAQRLGYNDPEVIALLERLNEKPDPVLASEWRQSHDNEDNDARTLQTSLVVPLDARGTQLTLQHTDIRMDNTSLTQESKGSVMSVSLELPAGDKSRIMGKASYVDIGNGADPNLQEWNWSAVFRTNVNRDWAWGAAYSDEVLYETTRLARNGIRNKEWMLNTDFRVFDEDTRFIAEFGRGDFSDGNKRNRWMFNLRRTAVFQDEGRLNYGVAVRLLDYSMDLNSGYWDPNNYRFGEIYVDWLDQSARKILIDAGAGLGWDESNGTKSRAVFRYNVGLRAPVVRDRLWLKAGYARSEGGNTAATQPGYTQSYWYFNAEYDF